MIKNKMGNIVKWVLMVSGGLVGMFVLTSVVTFGFSSLIKAGVPIGVMFVGWAVVFFGVLFGVRSLIEKKRNRN